MNTFERSTSGQGDDKTTSYFLEYNYLKKKLKMI